MTQPALSHQISNMEKELQTKLFVRSNNAVRLTPAGECLYAGLKGIWDSYKSLITQVNNIALGISGDFNIGLLEDLMLDERIARTAKLLKNKRPELNINIRRSDSLGLMEGLRNGSLDVAITLQSFHHSSNDFASKSLDSEALFVAITAEERDLPDKMDFDTFVRLLDEYPLSLISKHEESKVPIRDAVSGPLLELGRRGCCPLVNLVSSIEDLVTQISAGLGVIIVNHSHILRTVSGIRLVELELTPEEKNIWPNFQRAVIYATPNTNPNIDAFLSILDK